MKNIWDRELFLKAWQYATVQHAGQTYGGAEQGQKIDYINHIGSVVMEVIWCLQHTSQIYDANLAIQCAILHDTIEDTKTTNEDIHNLFGEAVAAGVQALTKNILLPIKQAQMLDSLERILVQPQEIAMVKVADRISNLYHPPFYWDNAKKLAYIEEAKLIHQKLSIADSLLLERLEEKINAYRLFCK